MGLLLESPPSAGVAPLSPRQTHEQIPQTPEPIVQERYGF